MLTAIVTDDHEKVALLAESSSFGLVNMTTGIQNMGLSHLEVLAIAIDGSPFSCAPIATVHHPLASEKPYRDPLRFGC